MQGTKHAFNIYKKIQEEAILVWKKLSKTDIISDHLHFTFGVDLS